VLLVPLRRATKNQMGSSHVVMLAAFLNAALAADPFACNDFKVRSPVFRGRRHKIMSFRAGFRLRRANCAKTLPRKVRGLHLGRVHRAAAAAGHDEEQEE